MTEKPTAIKFVTMVLKDIIKKKRKEIHKMTSRRKILKNICHIIYMYLNFGRILGVLDLYSNKMENFVQKYIC